MFDQIFFCYFTSHFQIPLPQNDSFTSGTNVIDAILRQLCFDATNLVMLQGFLFFFAHKMSYSDFYGVCYWSFTWMGTKDLHLHPHLF